MFGTRIYEDSNACFLISYLFPGELCFLTALYAYSFRWNIDITELEASESLDLMPLNILNNYFSIGVVST